MLSIQGVQIPKNKRGEISLTYIYGIGKNLAKDILKKAQVDPNKKAGHWTDQETKRIRIATQEYPTGSELRTSILLNIKRLKDIRSYRGIRRERGLPVRGQNTKNNARTHKGRSRPIANKRKNSK